MLDFSELRVFVAGHSGLVGSALIRYLEQRGYKDIITRSREQLDLTCQSSVRSFFEAETPAHVYLAAARVGGIRGNQLFPAQFIYENIAIASNVIDACYRNGVSKLLYLGSSCIYPKMSPQPIVEDYLLSGPLESTNESYAIAKIAGLKMCSAYNRQYGTNFLSVMPTNLYGPMDHYDLDNCHVLPALIRKFHEAKMKGNEEVVVWGTGAPRREFLFSDDLARACVFLMESHDAGELGEFVNIGVGEDISILDLAQMIGTITGFKGRIVFDSESPDGTPRKLLDVSRMNNLGWSPTVSLREGLERTYQDFQERAIGVG